MKILCWMLRKLRRAGAAGYPSSKLRDGDHPPQTSKDAQRSCRPCRPSVHSPRLHDDGGCRETSPDLRRPRSMDDCSLLQDLLDMGTLGMDPRCLDDLKPLHLRFFLNSMLFLVEKEQSRPETPKDSEGPEAAILLPVTGNDNSYANFPVGQRTTPPSMEDSGCEGGQNRAERKGTLTDVVKKVQKERDCNVGSTVRSGDCRGGTPARESKLYKLSKLFQKKIHLEGSIARKKRKPPGLKTQIGTFYTSGGGGGADHGVRVKDVSFSSQSSFQTSASASRASSSSSSCGGDSNGNQERWIKTDKDYLVLEL